MSKNITCLLIEDDHEDQEIFDIALSDLDLEVQCVFANSGIEALSLLEKNAGLQPDFIFLDLNMPLMNGMECLTRLRAIPRLLDTPIIIYSTSRSPAHREQSMRLGATGFYSKPTDISALSSKLHDFFQGNFD